MDLLDLAKNFDFDQTCDVIQKMSNSELRDFFSKNKKVIVSQGLLEFFLDILMVERKVDTLHFIRFVYYDHKFIDQYIIASCLVHEDYEFREFWLRESGTYLGECIPELIKFKFNPDLVFQALERVKELNDFHYHLEKLYERCCIKNKYRLLKSLIEKYKISDESSYSLSLVSCKFDSLDCLKVLQEEGQSLGPKHLEVAMSSLSPRTIRFLIRENYVKLDELPRQLPFETLIKIFDLYKDNKNEFRKTISAILNICDTDPGRLRKKAILKVSREIIEVWKKLLDIDDKPEPVRDL